MLPWRETGAGSSPGIAASCRDQCVFFQHRCHIPFRVGEVAVAVVQEPAVDGVGRGFRTAGTAPVLARAEPLVETHEIVQCIALHVVGTAKLEEGVGGPAVHGFGPRAEAIGDAGEGGAGQFGEVLDVDRGHVVSVLSFLRGSVPLHRVGGGSLPKEKDREARRSRGKGRSG